jgi:hypothetical protein
MVDRDRDKPEDDENPLRLTIIPPTTAEREEREKREKIAVGGRDAEDAEDGSDEPADDAPAAEDASGE